MNKPKVSVIVLSFNTKDITDKCLENLLLAKAEAERKKIGAEVIVLDNASSDGSAQMIRDKYPGIKLVVSKENTGFAKGNNMAMEKAVGDYFLLINSDVFVKKDTLARAVNYFEKHPDCDVLGCGLTYPDGSFQPGGGELPAPGNVATWLLGIELLPLAYKIVSPIHPKNIRYFAKDREVGWVTGAFMMLKREVYEKTKGFDEAFFMYTEEVEWSQRIKKAGFKIFYTPDFSVTHIGKASSKFVETTPLVKEMIGMKLFFKKHYPGHLGFLSILIWTSSLLRFLAFTLLGKKQKAAAYWKIITRHE